MAPLIPRDDPPAGVSEQWCDQIERRREVHAAVAEHDRRRIEIAPLVGRDADAVRVDASPSIGAASAGVGEHLVGDRHVSETNGGQPVRFGAMRSLAVLGLAATVSVALAACGGDDSGAAATTAVVTSATTTIATTTTSPEVTYVIQKGDSLSKIAKQFNLTVAQLITINNITDADHIEAGQVLIIVPAATPLPTTTAPPAPPAAPPST